MRPDPRRIAEAFPRRTAHVPPTGDEVRRAYRVVSTHLRSLFAALCIADGCGEVWPCEAYRRAITILRRRD